MIELVGSTRDNNNKDVYISSIIREYEKHLDNDSYTRVYNVYNSGEYSACMLTLVCRRTHKPLLYIVGVYKTDLSSAAVVHRGTDENEAREKVNEMQHTIKKYKDSAAVCYIRCIYSSACAY